MVIVPANVPAYLEKAVDLDVDVVVLDIQDSVSKIDRAKVAARQAAVDAVRRGGFKAREVCVRVNSPGSPWFIDDIRDVVRAGCWSIRLTHAYGVADVMFAERCIMAAADGREVEITLSVDMPSALMEIEEIARQSTLITSLWLSTGDFGLEMGAQNYGPHRSESEDWLAYARSRIVTVARAKGWNAGDLVRPIIGGDAGELKAAMRRSRAMGFDGSSVISPRYVPIANEVFGVSAEELQWAEGLVAKWRAMDDGPEADRAFRVIDGQGVFAPNYEYACRVVDYAAVLRGDPDRVEAYRKHGLASADYLTERRAAPIRAS